MDKMTEQEVKQINLFVVGATAIMGLIATVVAIAIAVLI